MKDLDVGDDISVTGEAMYYVLDNNATRLSVDLLNATETLKGTVDAIAITGFMTNESIPIMRQVASDPRSDTCRASQNPFGVMLLLRDPLLKGAGGKIHCLPEGSAVGLVMNNPNMILSKYR